MTLPESAGSLRPLIQRLLPFLAWVPGTSPGSVRRDLIAGVTGAILVLPQGIAYALIAGLPPEYGLYTAIVPACVAALFASSHHAVTGPTAANSIVVLAMVGALVAPDDPDYIAMVLILTMLVGLFQLALGLLRLGILVNFISDSVIVGFTAGAALLIAAGQLKHVFGLPLHNDLSLLETLSTFAQTVHQSNPYAVAVALSTFVAAMLVQRLRPRWPALLSGILVGSATAWLIDGGAHSVQEIGPMSGGLPSFSLPLPTLEAVRDLMPAAIALGMLALVQSISSARAVAMRSGQRIDGNQEFIGQGLANVVGSAFSCYAAAGSFTRSGANYDAGARTPIAAIIAALILASLLVIAPGITRYLAMPVMGGIVLLIAWNLISFGQIRLIFKSSRQEGAVLAVTFLATLFFALQFAIYVGVLLALALYLKRTARPRVVAVAPVPGRSEHFLRNARKRNLLECPQLKILRIDGSLFFGAVDHVLQTLRGTTDAGYRHVLLIGSGINFIDVAGANMLLAEKKRLRKLGGDLYLCSFKDPATEILRREPYTRAMGGDSVFSSPQEAIGRIFERLDSDACAICRNRIFKECARTPLFGSPVD